MGIYEETFEKISYRVKQAEERKNKTVIPDNVDDDDALVSSNGFRWISLDLKKRYKYLLALCLKH